MEFTLKTAEIDLSLYDEVRDEGPYCEMGCPYCNYYEELDVS